jgi:hypothetical protein
VVIVASAVRLLLVANGNPVVATKIASTGGVVGTLLGTLIPLLPAFLPLIVVGLLVALRWHLAALAIGAMVLVSPAITTWTQGWCDLWDRLAPAAKAWGHELRHRATFGAGLEHPFLVLVHHPWTLWLGGAARALLSCQHRNACGGSPTTTPTRKCRSRSKS